MDAKLFNIICVLFFVSLMLYIGLVSDLVIKDDSCVYVADNKVCGDCYTASGSLTCLECRINESEHAYLNPTYFYKACINQSGGVYYP